MSHSNHSPSSPESGQRDGRDYDSMESGMRSESTRQSVTVGDLVITGDDNTLKEAISVALSLIMYQRGIYHSSMFRKSNKHGLEIWELTDTNARAQFDDAIAQLGDLFLHATVKWLELSLTSVDDQELIEQWYVDVQPDNSRQLSSTEVSQEVRDVARMVAEECQILPQRNFPCIAEIVVRADRRVSTPPTPHRIWSTNCRLESKDPNALAGIISATNHVDGNIQAVPIRGSKEVDAQQVAKRISKARKKEEAPPKCSALPKKKKIEDVEHPPRTFACNDHTKNEHHKFCDNGISTTKYNLVNFLPKNLFEQFRRAANVYFLLIAALSFTPISPLNPITSVSPLVMVLGASAVKEALEDMRRRKADGQMNATSTEVIRKGNRQEVQWRDVEVGDVVYVENRKDFPADMICISSSLEKGMCYIETANLDGETNFKIRQAPPNTRNLTSDSSLANFACDINCEGPNKRLEKFEGSMKFDNEDISLSNSNFLPRGCTLRNTQWIYAVVVYTGHDSKVMQNATAAKSKRSTVEVEMNTQVVWMFFFLAKICFILGVGSAAWHSGSDDKYYLQFVDESNFTEGQFNPNTPFMVFFAHLFTGVILFNTLIPISLYVSLEFVKVFLAWCINSDIELYHEESDTPALSRTSGIIEDLGQIEYVFSDKTGTLTQNRMEFFKCTINGKLYGAGTTEIERAAAKRTGQMLDHVEVPVPQNCDPGFCFYDEKILYDNWMQEQDAVEIEEFFRHLAVCHTVVPETLGDGTIAYQAASPDEGALVFAAKNLGFNFHTREATSITITNRARQREEQYEVLNVLEFNSTRKRMSAIVRNAEGKLVLYCKGADTVIFERLRPNDPLRDITLEQLEMLAEQGLRTLCIAKCELDEAEYQQWNEVFKKANLAIADREGELAKAAEMIEKNLGLLGATAIEDKLQVGVPDTIANLAIAGIKIWVLTGDKRETAINIGFACSLLVNDMELIEVTGGNEQEVGLELQNMLKKFQNPEKPIALIIEGAALEHALKASLKYDFLDLACLCKAVVCCRVAPKQKAMVTALVRHTLGAVTLGIGDGANDVGMIQEAHVGIGISGEEGRQAVMSSDFAIAQFRFLQRLLLVHGRWSYNRVCFVVCYFFYKNTAFTLTMFWFQFYTGMSGQKMYDDWYQACYNLIFTALPVLLIGGLEQDLSANTAMNNPEVYWAGQDHEKFNTKVFLRWVIEGVFHSFLLLFIPLGAYKTIDSADGTTTGLFGWGTTVYTSLIFVVTIRLAISTHYWTWLNHVACWGSIALWFIFALVYHSLPPAWVELDKRDNVYKLIHHVGKDMVYWFLIPICVVVCFLGNYCFAFFERMIFYKPFHIFQEQEAMGEKIPSRERGKGSWVGRLSGTFKKVFVLNAKTGERAAYTGYSFSQEPGQHPYSVGHSPAAPKKPMQGVEEHSRI